MFKYLKKYYIFCILAPLLMFGEVYMDLLQPKLMKIIVDEGVLGLSDGGGGNLGIVFSVGLKMVLFVCIGGFCGILSGVFANLCSQNFGNDIRKDCFRKTLGFSFEQTDKFSTGSIITRITNDITQLQNLVTQCIRGFVRTGLIIIGGIICLLTLDLSFGIVIICALPVILGCVIFFIAKSAPIFGTLQKKLDGLNGVMQENISGARVVKAYVKEKHELGRFSEANKDLVDTQLRVLTLFAYMSPIMNIFLNSAVVAVIYLGGISVRGGGITPGAVMAAVTYITQILNAVMRMNMIFQTVSRGMASAERINEILDTEPSIADGDFDGATDIKGTVEFRNVSFGYGSSTILKNINLTINKGETVAVLGATGSGKTSLASLIPRFYDADSGQIFVDGVDVKAYKLSALRSKISVVLQKSELFNTTIEENILLGKSGASHGEVEAAAETAQAKEFIERRAGGYKSLAAEKGMSLSGGQRQRIAISRGIIKNAEILILDDSTSALDLCTEAAFYKSLNAKYPDTTKIIIAQRIASVKNADRIVILDEGRIDACGTHAELLETNEIYQDIYNSQLKGNIGEAV